MIQRWQLLILYVIMETKHCSILCGLFEEKILFCFIFSPVHDEDGQRCSNGRSSQESKTSEAEGMKNSPKNIF